MEHNLRKQDKITLYMVMKMMFLGLSLCVIAMTMSIKFEDGDCFFNTL